VLQHAPLCAGFIKSPAACLHIWLTCNVIAGGGEGQRQAVVK
jgi:hypothetical protein